MILLYVLENFLAYTATIITTSDDGDTLYVKGNLKNERPSLPYRTTGKGTPDWICVNLGGSYEDLDEVTFVGLFNHNLTTNPTLLELWGGNDCEVDTCITNLELAPDDSCGDGCGTQPIADFRNTWSKVSCPIKHQYWTLRINDPLVAETYYEIGELVLGKWQQFSRGPLTGVGKPWVRLSPGRADGPAFFMGKQRTHYGQDWSTFYSECEQFELKFTSQNDPCLVDEVYAFLSAVQLTGGRFVLVPDDTKPFCYYVIIDNLRDYADRLVYGRTRELREWRLNLKTLTEGVRLL